MATILVVEDDGVVERDLTNVLERIGCAVPAIASSAVEAIEKACALTPDLVMVNVESPDEAIVGLSARIDVPVVYLTSSAEQDRAHPFGYMMKPFSERDLRCAIEIAMLRHRVDAERRKRDQWFHLALELVGDGVVATDARGRITFANHVASSLLDVDALSALIADGHAVSAAPRKLNNKNGDEIYVLTASEPMFDERGVLAGHVLVIHDVSDRVRLHDQLAHADRMTSLGRMAAGIAHEINNPLAFIITNIEYTGGELRHLVADLEQIVARFGGPSSGPGDPKVGMLGTLAEMNEAIADARDGTERVRRIVEDLRSFSHPDVKAHAIDPRRAIELSVRICAVKAKRRATLRTVLEPTPHLEVNEGRLAQILVNLVSNAIESIPEDDPDNNEVVISARGDTQGSVEIEVRDTGQGMSRETREHIFQPFFTTKPAGAGTGLGLSIVHRLVSEVGGEIYVDSEQGRGSTFTLVFPPVRPPKKTELDPDDPWVATRSRILVIDDEPLILLAIRRLLGREHEIIDTQHPLDALNRLKAGERFDLILCDLVMPELSGWDFFDQVQRIAPDQAEVCVFLTGAALHPQARAFLARVGNRRLEKPFDADSLGRALREVLDQRRRRSLPREEPTH